MGETDNYSLSVKLAKHKSTKQITSFDFVFLITQGC